MVNKWVQLVRKLGYVPSKGSAEYNKYMAQKGKGKKKGKKQKGKGVPIFNPRWSLSHPFKDSQGFRQTGRENMSLMPVRDRFKTPAGTF